MSLQCAISGESLTPGNAEEVVVTPSGHLCMKRLLLTKLSENGGVDPFSDTGRPLSEDQLVSLQVSKEQPDLPPPPGSNSSFTGTLQQLSKEYDAVLLELFDTRKALQETRRELSQALYQNDAAVRVVARLSMERDAARQEAQRFQAAAGTSVATNGNQDGQAPSKKPRLEETAPADDDADLPLSNDLPNGHLQTMFGTWEKLHQARKSKAKTTYTLSPSWKVSNTQSWHKSTCKGIKVMAKCGQWIASAGKDKSILVYDSEKEEVAANISPKVLVDSLGIMPKEGDDGALMIVAGCGKEVRVYDSSTQELHGSCDMGSTIVHVDAHPTGKHCVAATKDGKVAIFSVESSGIQHLSTFSSEEKMEYSCGALHPDGLIFAAGTANGQMQVWDFKNRKLAATLTAENEDKLIKVVFSSNGYHVGTAHASGTVRVWDMRKEKLVTELNTGEKHLKSVTDLSFHPDGKYLAYGGQGGVHITMVKEWKISAVIDDVKVATGLLWDHKWIATSSDKGRTVTFHEQQVEG